jgi:hypothetical protein
MLTHGMDGSHKAKVGRVIRSAGYPMKRAAGGRCMKNGGYSAAHAVTAPTKGEPETPSTKLKSGGVAAAEKSAHRADKSSRSKLAKGGKPHTKINIMVAPGKSASAPMAPPALPPIAPMGGPAPRPPMAPGVAPPMMRPGMMPSAMKAGGRAKDRKIGHYEAGAGSGVGREEKAENYKKNVKKD